jgi:putative membrane protein
MKRSILISSAVTMMLTGGMAWADPEQYGYGGHMMGGNYGHGLLGGAVMILFWIGAIVITVLAIRWLSQNGGKDKRSSALDILQERLARGEIDADEYQIRKKALEG